jgi:Protein of unknown function (DUF3040)
VLVHRLFVLPGDDALMTLSEDDQNRLDRIENALMADDPLFAARLDVEAARRSARQRNRIAGYCVWIGLAIALLGAAFARGVLSIGTLVSLYGLALLAWSTLTVIRCRRTNSPTDDPDHPIRQG